MSDDQMWCAWTIPESTPERGWGAISKKRLRGLVVETMIDAQNSIAALRVHISPITEAEEALVHISLRPSLSAWREWQDFEAELLHTTDNIAHFILSRAALEAVIQAPADAFLYVFAEVRNQGTNYKVSHKISLTDLARALQFARLGE